MKEKEDQLKLVVVATDADEIKPQQLSFHLENDSSTRCSGNNQNLQHRDRHSELKDILEQAKRLKDEDKVLSSARLLQGVDDQYLEPIHRKILREAAMFQQILDQCASRTLLLEITREEEWIKQGEQHGRHHFCVYYKLSSNNRLTCRIETPIPSSLLVPLLSVLNESELYTTWIPQYTVPKFRVVKSEKLRQTSRCEQIILAETEMQWPICGRQLLLKAGACDDIDVRLEHGGNCCYNSVNGGSTSGGGKIIVRIQSMDDEVDIEELKGLEIGFSKEGYTRMELMGGLVFEKCPPNHPMVMQNKNEQIQKEIHSALDPTIDLVLVTFYFTTDPKIQMIPQSLINFFVRRAIGHIWGKLLKVADDISDGKRPKHTEAIARKQKELYHWVEERTRIMLLCKNHDE